MVIERDADGGLSPAELTVTTATVYSMDGSNAVMVEEKSKPGVLASTDDTVMVNVLDELRSGSLRGCPAERISKNLNAVTAPPC